MVSIQKLDTVWVAVGQGVDAVNDLAWNGERGTFYFLGFTPCGEAHEAPHALLITNGEEVDDASGEFRHFVFDLLVHLYILTKFEFAVLVILYVEAGDDIVWA